MLAIPVLEADTARKGGVGYGALRPRPYGWTPQSRRLDSAGAVANPASFRQASMRGMRRATIARLCFCFG